MQTFTNKTENSLANLAQLFDIPVKHGWKKKLAKALEINFVLLSTWLNRDTIPKKRLEIIRKQGYSLRSWLVTEAPPTEKTPAPAYDLPPTVLPIRDRGRGLVAGWSPDEVKAPAPQTDSNGWYYNAVREILASNEFAVAEALKANVIQFHELLLQKEKLKRMENEQALHNMQMRNLTDEVRRLKEELEKSRVWKKKATVVHS